MIASLKAMTPAEFGVYVSPKVRLPDGREVPTYRRTRFVNLLNRALMDLAGGAIENLGVAAPPRHGKTRILTELFSAWFLGNNPWAQVIVASHSARLAARFSQNTRDLLVEHGPKVFGVEVRPDRMAVDNWSLTAGGGMLAIGVGGSLVGFGADLLINDDVLADSAAALSDVIRNNTVDWYQSTAESRLNSGGKQIFTMQRWHGDDPFQRVVLDNPPEWATPGVGRTFVIPAIADHDPSRGESDPLGRQPGEALWPQKFPINRLRRIKSKKAFWFAAQYQQRPVPRGGGMFRAEWIEDNAVRYIPAEVDARVRYWDFASTQGDGDYTVGVLMSKKGDQYYIEDMVRGQWNSTNRDRIIRATCLEDNARYPFGITTIGERQPNGSGKDMGVRFEQLLIPYSAHSEQLPSGDKAIRADPLASAFGRGEVHVVRGTRDDPRHGDGHHRGRDHDWYAQLVVELTGFPGKHDDIVDACSGAFAKLALATRGVSDYASSSADDLADDLAEYEVEAYS